jgi:hypothetical protein
VIDHSIATNLTTWQIIHVEKCKDLIQGSAIAALKRVCMIVNTSNRERRVTRLKELWCATDSQEFRDRVESCIQYKWNTMPIKPSRFFMPTGTLRTGRMTIKCLEKLLNWTLY